MSKFLCNRIMVHVPYQIFGCILMLSLFLSVANTHDAHAYSAQMTINGSVSTNVNPTNSTNTTITTDEIGVTTNCRAGYNLTISGPSDRNLYLNGNSSINASGSYFTPVDGTSTLANQTNAWGYSLTANTDSGVFTPLPSGSTTLRNTSQTASETDIDDTVPIYYGVSTSNVIAPGLYKMSNDSTIVYQLTMDDSCISFTVEYNANGGTGTMEDQDVTLNQSTKLSANEFTAPAFGESYQDADGNTISATPNKLWTFWGWNTEVDGTGDWYKDREQVTNLAGNNETITLYAQWKQATLSDMVAATPSGNQKVIDHNLMQDMAPETCWNSDITTAANAPAATLLDYRGKVTTGNNPEAPEQYTVSKLADGNCWMTKNLNLGRTSGGPNGDGTITLTSDDTDTTPNYTLPAGTTTSARGIRTTNNSGNNNNGVYYDWWAATASQTISYYSGTAVHSVCPKNWDLPTSNQWHKLFNTANYSSSNPTTSPPSSFQIDGGYVDGTTFYQTNYGHFWTPVSTGATNVYTVRINGTSINGGEYSGYGSYRANKKNLRCLASRGTISVYYDGNGTTEFPAINTTSPQIDIEVNYASNEFRDSHNVEREGWGFREWNTEPDGSGMSIDAGSRVSGYNFRPNEVVTLYAQWGPQYKVTYINNCMYYNSSNPSCTQSVSDSIGTDNINLNSSGDGSTTLKAANYWTTIPGWTIAGWNTQPDGTGTEYKTSSRYAVSGQNAGSGITLYAHWVPTYTIQYDGNGADAGVMTNVKHTNTYEGDVFDLFASNYSKTGYGFAGWSFDQNAQPGGASRIYGPNEAIEAPTGTSGETKTLYAVWVQSAGDIQDWQGCSNMSIGDVTALKDTRDNNVYTVGKLADGNCWMMENLRLDAANSGDSSKAQGFSGVFTGLANPETSNFSNTTTSNSLYTTDTTSTTLNIITGDYLGVRFPRYNNTNTNTRNSDPSLSDNRANITTSHNTSLNAAIYSYGNYYTWPTAMANTEYFDTTAAAEAAHSSICPSGWQLPYSITNNGSGNTSGGLYYLGTRLNALTSNETSSRIWRSFPNNYLFSGYMNSSSTNNLGSGSVYWTSTSVSTTSVYRLNLGYSSVNSSSSTDQRYYGGSVRCVKANGLEVKLMLNDGTNKIAGRAYGEAGTSVTLPTVLTRTGYRLASWNTVADGTGTNYTGSYTIDPSATIGTTLYAQWAPAYTIQYNGNGADAGSMANVKHTNVAEGDVLDLFAPNYSKTNYGFAGWSFDQNAYPGGSSRIYGPNEAITAPARLSDSAKTLYAIWVQSAGNLQGWNGCSSMNIGDVTALKDTRDDNVYTVGKLADGGCWMMENLRLDAANSGDSSKAQGFTGVFTGLANPETSNFSYSSTTPNSLYTTNTSSTTLNIVSGARQFPRYNNVNTSSRNTDPSVNDNHLITNSAHSKSLSTNTYAYGNYYTWAAATANTVDASGYTEKIGSSICPSGWVLPYGGNTTYGNTLGGYYYLGSILGATTNNETSSRIWRSYPNNFVYSGFISSSSYSSRGSTASYQSSSQDNNQRSYGYNLYITPTSVYPGTDHSLASAAKGFGFPVRCVTANGLEVKLELNDGSGGVAGRIYVQAGETAYLRIDPYRRGYQFNGWNTAADGSGTTYHSSYVLDASATTGVTLYAQWSPQ